MALELKAHVSSMGTIPPTLPYAVHHERHPYAVQRAHSDDLTRHIGPSWLTVSQLCHRWQLGRKTVYKFIDAGVLPAWRVGSHLYRVSATDVLQFEAQNRIRPPQ